MEENKPEIISNIKAALVGVGKPNDDLSAEIVYNDLKRFAISQSHTSFENPEPIMISCNHTFSFKVKKQKSDFQKRMKNLQNSIK